MKTSKKIACMFGLIIVLMMGNRVISVGNERVEVTEVPNGNFETMIGDTWVPDQWDIEGPVWLTSAVVHEGQFSLGVNQLTPATLTQTIYVEPGIYTVYAHTWTQEDLRDTRLIANDRSTLMRSSGAIQIDGTRTFDRNDITGVRVENDGLLTIELDIAKDLTNETDTAFIDTIGFIRTGDLIDFPTDASDGELLNGNFSDGLDHWNVSDTSSVTTSGDGATGVEEDLFLSFWNESPYEVEVWQSIENLKPGTYTISAKGYKDTEETTAYIFARTYDGNPEVTADFSKFLDGWDDTDISPITVEVGEEGFLTVGVIVSGEAGAWAGVDDIVLTYGDQSDDYIINNSFEDGDTNWIIGGEIVESGFHGSYSLEHRGEGVIESYQLITDLEDGWYTLTGWIQNTGGHTQSYIYADEFGASKKMTALPRTNFLFDEPDAWKPITVRGIHVTNGQMKVGFLTEATDSIPEVRFDMLRLVRDDIPYELLIGGDVTSLTYVESHGGRFFDTEGSQRDPMRLLAENGWNIARIRVYNNPGKGRGNGTNYIPEGYQDLDDALSLARRAKDAGMQIQLTLHYSDYWSNPGTQIIPSDWMPLIEGKSPDEAVDILEQQVYEFTKDVLQQMIDQGTPPEFVAIGNETRGGILFPYGSTKRWDNLAIFYNAGARAVRELLPDSQVIIHLDDGGNVATYTNYFNEALSRNVDFDVIGTSYYPFWTNKTPFEFIEFADVIADTFNKPILPMETGFNHSVYTGAGYYGQLNHNGPFGGVETSSPELQKEFMDELLNATQSTKNGTLIGNIYWDPVMLFAGGQTGWAIFESNDITDVNVVDNTTLFDFDGRALPVLNSYQYNSGGRTTGYISGRVLDLQGNPIPGATVSNGINSTTTDILGEYNFAALPENTYTLTVSQGSIIQRESQTVDIKMGDILTDIDLVLDGTFPKGSISGTVENDSGELMENVLIRIDTSYGRQTALTNKEGVYVLPLVIPGEYEIEVVMDGYEPISTNNLATVNDGSNSIVNFTLIPNEEQ